MNIFKYFRHTAENALAEELAQRLYKELHPSLIEKRLRLLSVNKITKQLERVYQVALDHQAKHRIGFIKRAVLANSFRWELKKLGYPEDFIETATEGLVVTLSKARTPPQPKT